MAKKKNIKFQYFQVCGVDPEGLEYLYDLLTWLEKIERMPLKDRTKRVKSIVGRHEETRIVGVNHYALNFMRMDDSSNTYRVKIDESAQHIDLEDDEYIGKNTVALYDSYLHILMVQINRGGFGVAEIESYLNFFNNEDEVCYIRPIHHEFNARDCLNNNVVKLDVRFANISQFVSQDSRDFEEILESCNNMNATTARIEIGLGKSDMASLNQETVYNAVEDIKANRQAISSAKIKISDDHKSVIFDMFENIEHDFISFTVPQRGELAFEFVSDKMLEKYNESRGRVHSNLQGE